MNPLVPTTCLALCALLLPSPGANAQKAGAPALLGAYLTPDEPTKGQVVVVVPPEEIGVYVKKVEEAAADEPEWFREYSKSAKPGVPLPFHEKLGLSKAEYESYIKLWDERKMTPVPDGNVLIVLEQSKPDEWKVRVVGKHPNATRISLLNFFAKDGTFKSPNGLMTRLEDIDADARSILGKWTGHEWKFEEDDSLGRTKENFAIGKLEGTKYGLLVYRMQSTTASGRPTGDMSLVIRFPLPAK